jgi:hypothetical protein
MAFLRRKRRNSQKAFTGLVSNKVISGDIWGSHGDEGEDGFLPEYGVLECGRPDYRLQHSGRRPCSGAIRQMNHHTDKVQISHEISTDSLHRKYWCQEVSLQLKQHFTRKHKNRNVLCTEIHFMDHLRLIHWHSSNCFADFYQHIDKTSDGMSHLYYLLL